MRAKVQGGGCKTPQGALRSLRTRACPMCREWPDKILEAQMNPFYHSALEPIVALVGQSFKLHYHAVRGYQFSVMMLSQGRYVQIYTECNMNVLLMIKWAEDRLKGWGDTVVGWKSK